MSEQKISAIIFDLGGVLLNLDFNKTFDLFEKMGVPDFPAYFQQSHSNPLFAELEKGEVTPDAFYNAFRAATGIQATYSEIETAWNAMLLDFRLESMKYLQLLQGQYRLFLLSNTNQIHLEAFRMTYHQTFGNHGFEDHFEKAWYSHELGHRKPHPSCYTHVLDLAGLHAAETLFIDDTFKNIEGAKAVGLQTLWLENGQLIETLMPPLLS